MKIMFIFLLLFLAACQSRHSAKEEKQTMSEFTNHLIHETSPYLLQHAHNPVNWYSWGEEAFKKAEEENKPVFLSIGYAACHWCHVMEEESFEDEETAKLMNELFISIKVDREERPDVDQVYMAFVQMFTGSGGWPMSVFLTPQKKPFYGGTYFPAQDRYGRPGFKKLLTMVSEFYHTNKKDMNRNILQVEQAFKRMRGNNNASAIPAKDDLRQAAEQLSRNYDPDYGGFGGAPKFPAAQVLGFFLRVYKETGEKQYLDMVEFTLKNMAQGGIYDQLGGGFARYSVDAKWLAPHFEKMLYDNAQLANLYLDVYLITKDKFYLNIVREVLSFVSREMLSPEGVFYSSMDADSEGEEGKFYLWSKKEVAKILGREASEIFCAYYDVTESGNFEGKNILHIVSSPQILAQKYKKSATQIMDVIKKSRIQLLAQRKKRVAPATDDKIILSWNGLMLSAYARAYQVLQKDEYAEIIQKNISLMKNKLFVDRRLLHTYKGNKAKYDANLEDFANLIQGLIDAYEALFDAQYLEWAVELTGIVTENFWDIQQGGYFFTSATQEKLIQRLKSEHDQSIPSGAGIMLLNQLRLYFFTANPVYLKKSEKLISLYAGRMMQNPYSYASFLNALHFYIDNKPTAYVCRNYQCSLPVTSAEQLKALLFQD